MSSVVFLCQRISRRSFASAVTALSVIALTGSVLAAEPADNGPERIVSVGGAVTETLFALGLAKNIVAVDSTSMYPAAARELPQVGYLRQLSAEGVLAARPDMVLLGEGAGPASAVDQIKSSGLEVEDIRIGWSPASVTQLIRHVGQATDTSGKADLLASNVEQDFKTLAAALPEAEKPSVLLVLSAGAGPLLGAGSKTAAEAAVHLAGGRLALPDLEGYKPLSLEPVLAADPNYIIIPGHVLGIVGGIEGLMKLDIIAKTNAGREGRIIIADSLYLLGFGPRTPQAAADLARILYPDADIPFVRAEAEYPLIGLVE